MITKALGFLQVCYGEFQIKEILNIAPYYREDNVIKRSHSSLDLNGSKIHTNYLVEMQKIYDMMT